ncbi:MAG: stage III sporulation protein AB [Acidibacillus sp.]|nr:stage III sporulation protein AB [Acidibacillus sp.]
MNPTLWQIAGASIVMVGSAVYGRQFSLYFRARPQELRQLAAMLRSLRVDISYQRLPLQEAFLHASRQGQAGHALSELFITASEALGHPGSTAFEAWRDALQQHLPKLHLSTEDVHILESLGHSIGMTGVVEQAAQLDAALALLNDRERDAMEERTRYERVYQTLGVLAGVLIVVMLI